MGKTGSETLHFLTTIWRVPETPENTVFGGVPMSQHVHTHEQPHVDTSKGSKTVVFEPLWAKQAQKPFIS